MEIDRRRLYLGEGCASMFAYCTQVLHLSEGGAYNRIEAARAAREYPVILELFEQLGDHADRGTAARAASHPGESRRRAGLGTAPVETAHRRARGVAAAEAGCAGGRAEIACPSDSDSGVGGVSAERRARGSSRRTAGRRGVSTGGRTTDAALNCARRAARTRALPDSTHGVARNARQVPPRPDAASARCAVG